MELQFNDSTVPVDTACNICGQPMRLYLPKETYQSGTDLDAAFSGLVRMAVHDECYRNRLRDYQKKEYAEQVANQVVSRNKFWEGICPPEFRAELDFQNPACKRRNFASIMAWKFGPKGLIAHGKSGRCKTRFIFKLCEREHKAGRSILAIRHQQFRMTISRLASDNQEGLGRFMGKLVSVDILFIDDLGKGTLTPASEEAISEVIDHRGCNNRPIFFSTNDDFETLQKRLSTDRGEPLIRRILDNCQDIPFD